jgi:hypothetical protein
METIKSKKLKIKNMERLINTKFYTFSQNNSGGHFRNDEEKGIGEYVIIEAISNTHANGLAEDLGIYFDGCRYKSDCPCCGDRWSRVSDYDGYDIPSIYGTPVEETEASLFREEVYIHYLDGTVKTYIFKPKPKKNKLI